MKIKSILSLLVLTLVLFVSCSSDDDTVPQPQAQAQAISLIGNWKVQSKSKNGMPQQLETCEGETIFTFMTQGNFSLQTKSLNQQTNACENDKLKTGTYSTSGNELTVNIDMMMQNATFKLTATTLAITYVDTSNNSTEVINFIRVQ